MTLLRMILIISWLAAYDFHLDHSTTGNGRHLWFRAEALIACSGKQSLQTPLFGFEVHGREMLPAPWLKQKDRLAAVSPESDQVF